MSMSQAHLQTSIRRAPATKPKTKSAGALRMARLRRQKKQLAAMAERYRTQFYESAFRMLADETPKGRSTTARQFINAAWFQAGRLPPRAAASLARCFNSSH